jgi:D-threo-aldose 1-dehydrogenase
MTSSTSAPGTNALDTRKFGGTQISRMGLGGAPLGNLYAPIPEEVAIGTIARAWELGVRFFDTAPLYGFGLSEHRMGQVLRTKPRDQFVISSKVGRLLTARPDAPRDQSNFYGALPFVQHYDYGYDAAMRSIEDSLQRLGLARLDIVFIHDCAPDTHGPEKAPAMFKAAMEGAYRALDKLRAEGTIAAVGLGVNGWEVCLEAMKHGDFDGFLLAGRYTLADQTALPQLLPECVKRNAAIVLGGPYNSGILATGARPGATFNYAPATPEMLRRVAAIEAVCDRFAVPLRAAALQFPFGHPALAAVIPGARSPAEVEGNLALITHHIPPAFWAALASEGLLAPEVPLPA